MKLRILSSDPAGHWMAVHKQGCADLRRVSKYTDDYSHPWVEDHDSLTDAVESFASDFISEGSMTIDEALQHIYFYPCVDLPLK